MVRTRLYLNQYSAVQYSSDGFSSLGRNIAGHTTRTQTKPTKFSLKTGDTIWRQLTEVLTMTLTPGVRESGKGMNKII